MSELLDGTGHPRHFGFFQCARCGTQRPEAELGFGAENGATALSVVCRDVAWCGKQAGVGLGQFDVPKERP